MLTRCLVDGTRKLLICYFWWLAEGGGPQEVGAAVLQADLLAHGLMATRRPTLPCLLCSLSMWFALWFPNMGLSFNLVPEESVRFEV